MHTPRPIELLAPARDLRTGREAILHGADAVYIGGPSHSARSAAGNSIDEIAALCEFAHPYYARVYVTVNTILYDGELAAVREMIEQLWQAGVDALIVQDTALTEMSLPPIALHASTQMDNRTTEDLLQRSAEGFTRTVLARELSLDQIRRLHRDVPGMDLEAFVHGALCVGYSGRCYASQYKFGRSANRGCCAQFCRLAFDLTDSEGRVLVRDKHLLSLRDMCRLHDVEALIDAGVSSLKIEGRLKDVSYVKNVTAAYRRALDEILQRRSDKYCRASAGRHEFTFSPDVNKSFNRGFTEYFLHEKSVEVHEMHTPKSKGEWVGNAKECTARTFGIDYANADVSPLVPGDGLCYMDRRSGKLVGLRVNRIEGGRVYPAGSPTGLSEGTPLYRNHDQAFLRALEKPTATRRIPLCITFRETEDGYALHATEIETGLQVTTRHRMPHEAAQRPQADNVRLQLAKLGDTPFVAERVEVQTCGERFIPSSVLASMRRGLIEALLREKAARYKRERPGQHHPLPDGFGTHRVPGGAGKPAAGSVAEDLHYQYNIANKLAASHYETLGFGSLRPAFELQQPRRAILMTCRHCIRRALGHCLREQGKSGGEAEWRAPLYLRTTDGERFPLTFDCARCEMLVGMPEPQEITAKEAIPKR